MVHYLDSELFTLVNIKCTNKIIYTITMSTTFSSDAKHGQSLCVVQ